ncbi:MAG: hypothetical protein NTW96_07495 [Planctomycetia bacterium]|nr:hypothetical protein [Planctomycetia bacterium]
MKSRLVAVVLVSLYVPDTPENRDLAAAARKTAWIEPRESL